MVAPLAIAGAIAAALGTVAFVEFIYEEAVQSSTFPIYIAIQNRNYDVARLQIARSRRIVDSGDLFTSTVGFVNPLSYDAFKSFFNASRGQLDAYEKVIAAGAPLPGLSRAPKQGYDPELMNEIRGNLNLVLRTETPDVSAAYENLKSVAEGAQFSKAPKTLPQLQQFASGTQGTVRLTSTPSRAGIWVNDIYIRKLTPEDLVLDIGSYEIGITKPGYESQEINVTVKPGVQEIDVQLRQLTAGEARKLPTASQAKAIARVSGKTMLSPVTSPVYIEIEKLDFVPSGAQALFTAGDTGLVVNHSYRPARIRIERQGGIMATDFEWDPRVLRGFIF
jgi:hypothetical protein